MLDTISPLLTLTLILIGMALVASWIALPFIVWHYLSRACATLDRIEEQAKQQMRITYVSQPRHGTL